MKWWIRKRLIYKLTKAVVRVERSAKWLCKDLRPSCSSSSHFQLFRWLVGRHMFWRLTKKSRCTHGVLAIMVHLVSAWQMMLESQHNLQSTQMGHLKRSRKLHAASYIQCVWQQRRRSSLGVKANMANLDMATKKIIWNLTKSLCCQTWGSLICQQAMRTPRLWLKIKNFTCGAMVTMADLALDSKTVSRGQLWWKIWMTRML